MKVANHNYDSDKVCRSAPNKCLTLTKGNVLKMFKLTQ